MGVVASPNPKEKGDGGADRPSVRSEFLGEFGVLHFFTCQGLLKTGVAPVSDFQDLEGREGAELCGPVGLAAIEQGIFVIDD